MTLQPSPRPARLLRLVFLPLLCLLLLTLALFPPASLAAQGPEAITLSGRVVNGTEGGEIPATLPITLHAIDSLAGRVATYNGMTDEQGGFTFGAVAPLNGGSYVLVMDYAGMRYSELLEAADLSKPAELTVYEITRDLSVVQVKRQAMIIADVDETAREVRALEVLSISNSSDRTLLPELTNITNPADINFLRFSLPADAGELSVQSTLPGGDIIPMGTGFAVTAPVLPGDHEITYTYQFPYQGDSVTFNQRLIQGAEQYQVLAPVSLSQMQVTPLEPRPRIAAGGVEYLVWEAGPTPPGRGLALRISNLPQPSLTSRLAQYVRGEELWLAAIPAALAVALAALLLWAGFRAPRTGAADLDSAAVELEQPHRQSLIQAIAVLDDRFERGQMQDEEYRPRREELMGQLRRMMASSGSDEGAP